MIEDRFTEDRAARVPGTEKKDVHGVRGFGITERNGSMISGHGEVADVSTYGVGGPKLYSPSQAIESSTTENAIVMYGLLPDLVPPFERVYPIGMDVLGRGADSLTARSFLAVQRGFSVEGSPQTTCNQRARARRVARRTGGVRTIPVFM
jgi:hypothetical protein